MSDEPLVVTGVESADELDLAWQKKAEELQFDALETVRSTAEKWAASLTAVLGAVGLAALLAGPDVFNKLSAPSEQISKAAFFVAALSALLATIAATFAAQGTSKRLLLPGSGTLRDFSEIEVGKAVRRLFWSRLLAALAVVAVLVSAGFLLWGSADKPTSETTNIRIQDCQGLSGTAAGTTAPAGEKPDFQITCSGP